MPRGNVEVVGREAELAAAEHLLGAARARFAGLVFEGEAGSGKSTVWRASIQRAAGSGFAVLSCRPAETEAKLTFSAIADLLESVPDDVVSTLPVPQRRALEVALLERDPEGAAVEDRVLATAVRSTLAALSARRPELLAIDDLHCLDVASAEILGYVVRRLGPEAIALLGTRRSGEQLRLDLGAPDAGVVDRRTVGPLSLAAVHQLLKRPLGEAPSRPTLVRIHEATAGNPFFALEIARSLAEQPPAPAGAPLPVPSAVHEVVGHRLARLPEATREVLLVAAALGDPREALVAAVVGRPIQVDLDPAHERSVASRREARVEFEHPLFGAVLYASTSPAERRRLHRALAAAIDEPEERARHLALAATGQDEEAAAAVHAAARRITRRGAPAAAVELMELALALGEPGSPETPQRTFDLADYLCRAGDNRRALAVLDAVPDWASWDVRLHGDAFDLYLEAAYWLDGPTDELVRVGERLLATDAPLPVRAQTLASLASKCEHDLRRADRYAEEALAALRALGDDADPLVAAAALANRVRNRLVLGDGLDRDAVEGVRALEARIPPERRPPVLPSDMFGQWLKYADDVEESFVLLQEGLRLNAAAGSEKGTLNKLQHLALAACLLGDYDAARRYAEEACELYDQEGTNVIGYAPAILAIVEAHAGDVEKVRAIEERHQMAEAQDVPHLLVALGLLELSLGDDARALECLGRLMEGAERAGHREPGIHRVHGNAAEAAVGVGDLERAEAIAVFLQGHGERTSHRWSVAVAARLRALLDAARGDLDSALVEVDAALVVLDGLSLPFERARTLLVKGVVERRAPRRAAANATLGEAVSEFERLGAALWAARARGELERVGLRRSSAELTPSEQRVAELASSGMTNREVAAALFISPKTVEANLARVYRKLGIASRAELGVRMAERLKT